jgi:flagellar hook protein FlgE
MLHPLGNGLCAAHVEFTHVDGDYTVSIPVESGTYVGPGGVSVVVETAFDSTGTNASLLIGVEGDTDALMNATSSAIQTQSAGSGTAPKIAANSEANLNGYYFEEDGKLVLTFTAASAGATAGKAIARVVLSNVVNSGIIPA